MCNYNTDNGRWKRGKKNSVPSNRLSDSYRRFNCYLLLMREQEAENNIIASGQKEKINDRQREK